MYNISNLSIGSTLRKYRKIKHLSLDYIGNKIGKTKATVSKYERDEIIPDFITVLEFCNVLEINLQDVFPSLSPIYLHKKIPFASDKVFLYYMTGDKLIASTISFNEDNSNPNSVCLYNGIKTNFDCAYFYNGNFESFDSVVYINLKNNSSKKFEMERVQIIVALPLSNCTDLYNCFITGLTPNLIPTVKKGIITLEPINFSKRHMKKLKLSKEELRQISIDNSWTLYTKLYDESFYDFNNIKD